MHLYSLRLGLVMIAIFSGVSVAKAADKCWILYEWRVTKGEPAGKPRAVSQCLEGKIAREGETPVCERWTRRGNRKEIAFFTDQECKIGNLAMGSDTARIPEDKKNDLKQKHEDHQERRQSRQEQPGGKDPGKKWKSLSNQPPNGPGTDPNHAGTDPDTGGARKSIPTN